MLLAIIIIVLLVILLIFTILNFRTKKVIIYEPQTPKVQKEVEPSIPDDVVVREGLTSVQYAPAYDPTIPGPPFNPIGGPIPSGALKETNRWYNRQWAYGNMPGPFLTSVNKYFPTFLTGGLDSLNIALPGTNNYGPGPILATNGIDTWGRGPGGIIPAVGGGWGSTPIPSPYAWTSNPAPAGLLAPNPVGNPITPGGWERVGIVQTKNGNGIIMNLFQRPIAPGQDLWEYQVEDRDGFVIPLREKTFLSDGDTIKSIRGKENEGEWRVDIFENEKYIWY